MLVVGISYIVFWGLIELFTLSVNKAALVTGVVFILLGLLLEGIPQFRRP